MLVLSFNIKHTCVSIHQREKKLTVWKLRPHRLNPFYYLCAQTFTHTTVHKQQNGLSMSVRQSLVTRVVVSHRNHPDISREHLETLLMPIVCSSPSSLLFLLKNKRLKNKAASSVSSSITRRFVWASQHAYPWCHFVRYHHFWRVWINVCFHPGYFSKK